MRKLILIVLFVSLYSQDICKKEEEGFSYVYVCFNKETNTSYKCYSVLAETNEKGQTEYYCLRTSNDNYSNSDTENYNVNTNKKKKTDYLSKKYEWGGVLRDYSNENINYKKSENNKNYKCGKKYKCSQMTSCKEAYFYYEVCGVSKLDRDKDGIPCENLCGH